MSPDQRSAILAASQHFPKGPRALLQVLVLGCPPGEDEITVTAEWLAEKSGYHWRHVWRLINTLEALDGIDRINNGRFHGEVANITWDYQRPNTYRIISLEERLEREAEVEILTVTADDLVAVSQDVSLELVLPENLNTNFCTSTDRCTTAITEAARAREARVFWLPTPPHLPGIRIEQGAATPFLPLTTHEETEMDDVPTRQQRRAAERAAAKAERKRQSGHEAALQRLIAREEGERRAREEEELRAQRDFAYIRAAYEHLAPGRLAPEVLDEFKRLNNQEDERSDEQEVQLFELERIINAAVPTAEVQQYLIEHFGYGRSDEWAVPVDIWWPPDKDYANDSTAAPTGQ